MLWLHSVRWPGGHCRAAGELPGTVPGRSADPALAVPTTRGWPLCWRFPRPGRWRPGFPRTCSQMRGLGQIERSAWLSATLAGPLVIPFVTSAVSAGSVPKPQNSLPVEPQPSTASRWRCFRASGCRWAGLGECTGLGGRSCCPSPEAPSEWQGSAHAVPRGSRDYLGRNLSKHQDTVLNLRVSQNWLEGLASF